MATRNTGKYDRTILGGEEVAAFIPKPLPPKAPPLVLGDKATEHVRNAEQALARLELAGEMVPSLDWFIYAFVRKEAVVSSQIEGTQATLVDLLNFETSQVADPTGLIDADVEEVCNYLDALTFAREQLASESGPPLSMRLLNATHARLMSGVRGSEKQPGEIRVTQNWTGGTRPGNAAFVPPPPGALAGALSAFEKYIHTKSALPPLVRAGLLHVQFETIHPYLDGNGRMGRLLIILLLEHWKLLTKPVLYLSLYFKQHRDEYYRRLDAVRVDGDWEGWIDYFLEAVATIADEAVASARELFELVEHDRRRVLTSAGASLAAARLFELLPRHPIVSIGFVVEQLETTKPTAGRAVEALVNAGVLVESTGKKRDRSWAYRAYLDRLRVGTEILSPGTR